VEGEGTNCTLKAGRGLVDQLVLGELRLAATIPALMITPGSDIC
jgi:hypothetical protein